MREPNNNLLTTTMKIAILLTTFNRKQKTLSCLRSLNRQILPVGTQTDIYLTDDSSSDGTAEAVAFHFPEVRLLKGNGSLFWAGGMRNSWNAALPGDYDYYFLLNDDTLLKDNAMESLLQYNIQAVAGKRPPAICIGSTCDHEGNITYGGKALTSRYSLQGRFIFSEDEFMPCDLGNANIMLVPSLAVKRIGILSSAFTHGIADYDYTLKARKAGIDVLVAPGFLGTCIHDHDKNWKSARVRLKERIAFLKSPKGLAYSEYLGFIRYHFPLSYPMAFSKLWLKTLFPVLWDTFKK